MNPPTTYERPHQLPAGTGALGLFWLLLSLGMLFLTTLVAFWVVRGGMELEKLSVIPSGMPWGVWLASAVLIVLSLAAEAAARKPQADPMLMRVAGASSVVFLAVQAWNWYELYAIGHGAGSGLYAFCFFVLTGLHAAHVIGGVVYQFHAIKFAEDQGKRRAAAVYWHFLFLCWLLILGTVHGTATEAGPIWVGRVFFVIACACAVVATVCWLLTIRLIWKKDGAGFGVLALFPLFSVVFGWVRFQEHDNLRVMIAWQVSIALGMLGWIMSSSLV